jgi:AraC-type DNA-binding domain-containing proteins
MELRKLNIDMDYKELFEYKDKTFPVDICHDNYSELYNSMLDIHYHNDVEYTLVLKGALEYSINGSIYTLNVGECAFVNANTLHTVKSVDSVAAESFVLLFPLSYLAADITSTIFQKYIQPISGKGLQGAIINWDTESGCKIIELLKAIDSLHYDEYGYELLCSSIIFSLWKHTVDFLRKEEPIYFSAKTEYRSAEIAREMLMYIHEHFGEHLTVPLIADAICVSPSECFRCFKIFTHKTPIEYIKDYRLKCAEKALVDTTNNITEIGNNCGFCSSSYFSKLFKIKYKMSPREFRNKYA